MISEKCEMMGPVLLPKASLGCWKKGLRKKENKEKTAWMTDEIREGNWEPQDQKHVTEEVEGMSSILTTPSNLLTCLDLPRSMVGEQNKNGCFSIQNCFPRHSSCWWLENPDWLGLRGGYEVVLVSWWATEREDLTKNRKGSLIRGSGRQLLLEARS